MAIEQKQTKEKMFSLRRWLNQQWLVKNIPFFLFLTVLTILYIANGNYADKMIRDINKTAKELKELQYEYKQVKGEILFRSKGSELIKTAEPLGLKEPQTPAQLLTDSIKQ